MTTSDSALGDGKSRSDRIQQIANDFLQRRASGDNISEESVIAAHPDLMPELGKWLRAAGLVQNGKWRADETRQPGIADFSDPTIQHGAQIGPYRILSVLGEGGCGMVYLAESEKPIKRRVALKVIKPGMDSKQVLARFEAERQALAVMDHPGVAKVFDADTTDAGRPYFVMEYVKGVPITEHCDRNRLDIKERMNLFAGVCDAVQHAHQKGVIHRDIKPTNVLVSVDGNRDVPKVIDFGLVKAIHQPLTDRSLYTQQGQIIGTPAYMSPEQADVTAQDIDTRADIYSLGVVLYELLAGVLPFERTSGTDEELRRAINEQDPSTPSSRLATLDADRLTEVTRARRVEQRELKRELKGDLDWIVLKCLEKDRKRRYETANGLAMDVRRYLDNEPILARPPSALYRFSKLARRHKATIVATLVVSALGLGGISWQWREAVVAQREEELAKDRSHRDAYAADMLNAQRALGNNDLGRARMLVDRYMPQPGQLDVSGFEWRYLWEQTRGDDLFVLGENKYNVLGLAISPDGKYLASASGWGAGDVRIWDDLQRPQTEPYAIPTDGDAVGSVAFAPDNRTLAYGTRQGKIVIWDLVEQVKRAQVPGRHSERRGALCFLPNGHLTVGDIDGVIKVWELTGDEPRSVTPPMVGSEDDEKSVVLSLAVSPKDDFTLAALYSDNVIRLWNPRSGDQLDCVKLPSKGIPSYIIPSNIRFSPNGQHLVCAQCDVANRTSTLSVLDTETGQWDARQAGHSTVVTEVAFSHDGKLLASACRDQTIRIWDTSTWKARVLQGHLGEVSSVVFSHDGGLLYSGGKDGKIRAWSMRSRSPASRVIPFDGDGQEEWDTKVWRDIAMSWDGSAFCAAKKDGLVIVLDVASGKKVGQHRFPPLQDEGEVPIAGHLPLAVSKNGRVLATALKDRSVRLWYAEKKDDLAVESPFQTRVASLEFSPAGDALFILREKGRLERVSVASDQTKTASVAQVESRPHSISFSSDGRRVAIGQFDGRVSSWKFVDERLDQEWQQQLHFENVDRVVYFPVGHVYFPFGHTVATSGRDGKIKFWDVSTKPKLQWVVPDRDAFYSMALSKDGERLAAGTNTGKIKLWDVGSRRQVATLEAGKRVAYRITFSDENTLACLVKAAGVVIFKSPTWEQIAAEEPEMRRREGWSFERE